MTENDDNHKLGSFKSEHMMKLKPVLKSQLHLTFVDDPTDPSTIAHRIIGFEDEFTVKLLCTVNEKLDYEIYISGAGLHHPLVAEYQLEVNQALAGLPPA